MYFQEKNTNSFEGTLKAPRLTIYLAIWYVSNEPIKSNYVVFEYEEMHMLICSSIFSIHIGWSIFNSKGCYEGNEKPYPIAFCHGSHSLKFGYGHHKKIFPVGNIYLNTCTV